VVEEEHVRAPLSAWGPWQERLAQAEHRITFLVHENERVATDMWFQRRLGGAEGGGGGGFGTKLAYRSGSFIINRALGFGHGKIPGKTPAHNRKATNRRNAPEAERSGLSKTRFSGTHTHTHIRPSIDMV